MDVQIVGATWSIKGEFYCANLCHLDQPPPWLPSKRSISRGGHIFLTSGLFSTRGLILMYSQISFPTFTHYGKIGYLSCKEICTLQSYLSHRLHAWHNLHSRGAHLAWCEFTFLLWLLMDKLKAQEIFLSIKYCFTYGILDVQLLTVFVFVLHSLSPCTRGQDSGPQTSLGSLVHSVSLVYWI